MTQNYKKTEDSYRSKSSKLSEELLELRYRPN